MAVRGMSARMLTEETAKNGLLLCSNSSCPGKYRQTDIRSTCIPGRRTGRVVRRTTGLNHLAECGDGSPVVSPGLTV